MWSFKTGVGNLFWTVDRFETEIFSRTGLLKTPNIQQGILITTHVSYYNFDSMRTLSLFLPQRDAPT